MYELINYESGLENEISDSDYNSLPRYKQLKYRRKDETSKTYIGVDRDTAPALPSTDWSLPDTTDTDTSTPDNSFEFGGGSGGGAGASGDYDSGSSDSGSYGSGSSDSGSYDSGSSD